MVMWRSRDPNINSSFASNQTVTSTLLLPPSSFSYRLGYNFLYISTSSFWSRSPTCLTEPRPSSLLDGRLARKDYLQISAFLDPVVVERGGSSRSMESHWRSHEWSGEKTAGRTRSGLTLGTSTSASIAFLCGQGPSSLCGGDGRRSRHNFRWSSGFTLMDPDGWLDVNVCFISWMKLRLRPLGLQKG